MSPSSCGHPAGDRANWGTATLCARCLCDRKQAIREHLGMPPLSIGRPGLGRPEYGPEVFNLICEACGAGWCGRPGEECHYCAISLELTIEEQRRLLLTPEQGQNLQSWVERLARGVESGLITQWEARNAAKRAKGRQL